MRESRRGGRRGSQDPRESGVVASGGSSDVSLGTEDGEEIRNARLEFVKDASPMMLVGS